MATLLSLSYSSNLRYFITLPRYDPEINTDADVLEYAQAAHVSIPDEYISTYFTFIGNLSQPLYDKVQ